ncbi:TnsD family transposase [Paenibacillus sp. MBLB2552]|uniref:TnsD family transposase n=1 Tax=Paenibacillus mellifer TaxID=2937794 RepID=A0A9X2BPM1_9BACL|nr:TnsD family Tn7-like transposition protein [Paenibacillus mellifer]MCK8487022.1 TnsD family transposase [Paenibacillus mellifer]
MVILSSFFPSIFPDELLYSILARYHLFVGNTSTKATILDLYDRSSVCAVTGLPAHIEKISLLMKGKVTAQELIVNHTLFPYFACFLPDNRIHFMEQTMTGDSGGSVHARLGLLASAVKIPPNLKYCGQCLKDDIEEYGVPYWHRSHQIPGVHFCHKHKCELLESTISTTMRRNRHEFVALNEKQVGEMILDEAVARQYKELFIYIAKQSYKLLHTDYERVSLESLHDFYLSKLYENAMITPSGSIRFEKLRDRFLEVIDPNVLEILFSTINTNSDDTWLHKLIRKDNSGHPLRHLLMLFFLNETFETVARGGFESYHPFGMGPWPCLNNVCEHFRRDVINHCEVTSCTNTRLPVGTFKCSCGFVYSRRGPDSEFNDRFKVGRIKQFGDVWEARFNELKVTKDISLRQMANILGVHFSTIGKKFQASDEPKNLKCMDTDTLQLESYRERWTALSTDFPESTVTELRHKAAHVYAWLYRHDSEWLQSFKRDKKSINSSRVDWEERDTKLIPLILKATHEIKSIVDHPMRVTISEIGRRIGRRSWLEKKIACLPLSRKLILEEIETSEQFQIRRIKIAAEKIYREEPVVLGWRVIREAGLRKEAAQRLRAQVQNQVDYYNDLKTRNSKSS